jgi:hypothetical protein
MRPRLRRERAQLAHHLIEAIAQTLEARPDITPARARCGWRVVFGCLAYSVKFSKGLGADGRRFASPILFPETVVNAPLSHVAAELGIRWTCLFASRRHLLLGFGSAHSLSLD